MVTGTKVKNKAFFITATDTGVGKTVAGLALALLMKDEGHRVGYIKPVQCGGNDTEHFKLFLELEERVDVLNPYFAREPLSPNVAFRREKIHFDKEKVLNTYQELREKYDVLIVEGAGGLSVPITDDYLMSDLIRDMDLEVVVVSRLGLGTINHTLLTVNQARDAGLDVKGVLFNRTDQGYDGVAEETNPDVIRSIADVEILGTVPFIKEIYPPAIVEAVRGEIDLEKLLSEKRSSRCRLEEDDKKYIWHPFTQMKDWMGEKPLVIDRARGSYLYDIDGNRYLDGVSSLWVNVHGHRHPLIDKAIKEQLDRLSHSTLLGLSNTPAIELARELANVTPEGLDKVFYSDNGSTAAEIGLKIAYQYWQNIGREEKTQIVHLANSYHGDTLGSVSVGGIDLFHKVYSKLIFKTIQVDFPDCYRAPEGKTYPDYAFECLENFEKLLEKESKRIAAFIVEPVVQGAAGMVVWPEGILKKMADLCRKYEVLLIADEVATGFGRTGKMFACEHEGVTPDILCLAKGLSGGYLPLAATLTSRKVFDGFVHDYKDKKTFFHGHTYTGNPLCCAAALANLKVFKKEKTLARLQPKIKYLRNKLQMFYNLAHVGDVRQCGFMVGIELVKDKGSKNPFSWEERIGVQVCEKIREKGVILRPLGSVIVMMPPLSISQDEIDHLTDAAYWAIKEVTGNYHERSR